ncbi:hypothetical protein [Streptomyces sp. NPDC018000]|uniref:hypothetical protein n=1 Tax=Streptomyces sp. NPDC018000 TaxID=3365028 RepID=UPI003798B732
MSHITYGRTKDSVAQNSPTVAVGGPETARRPTPSTGERLAEGPVTARTAAEPVGTRLRVAMFARLTRFI